MGQDFGTSERELLEGSAAVIYEAAAARSGLAANDPRIAQQGPDRPAFDLLVDLGLITATDDDTRWVAVDPSAVQSRVVAPMGQRAADLLEESSRWSLAFGRLGQSFRRTTDSRNPVTHIRGLANINRFLSATVEDAREELLTAQPTRGRSSSSLANANDRDMRAVQRGVQMRTLYQHSARRSAAIREYVDRMAPYGTQVRTLEEFFNRMIIVDRAVAIVPGAEGNNLAIAIHEESLVAYLADVFERYWERAKPYDDRAEATARTIAQDVRNMTVRMLVEGHSDPASAKRVGVSTRTYAGYIASLKDEYGVQTRFQLGYAMGQHEVQADQGEAPAAG